MKTWFPVGAVVLVDGRDRARVSQVFPEGSSLLLAPHYVLNFEGGDRGVRVSASRVGVKKTAGLRQNPSRSVGKSDVAAGKKLARDITVYAQKTARDMGCSFTDAVRAMNRDPGVVAGELGVSAPFVTVWCEGVLARSTG